MLPRGLAFLSTACLLVCGTAQELRTVEDLGKFYYDIFKSGNRNAASHLWTTFLLGKSESFSAPHLENLFHGFCALPRVGGGMVDGVTHHCCWPCICDLQDLVRVDQVDVRTADGMKTYDALVIGDPCLKPEKLSASFVDPFSQQETSLADAAPEVKCESGKLAGATFSKHGHPIIGMFFTSQEDLQGPAAAATTFDGQCIARKDAGFNSGMGLIFHKVASITTIDGTQSALSMKAEVFGKPLEFGVTSEGVAQPTRLSFAGLLAIAAVTCATLVAAVAVMYLRNSRIRAGSDVEASPTSPRDSCALD